MKLLLNSQKITKLLTIFAALLAFLFLITKTSADSSDILILWNTNSFSPSNYEGKKLPSNYSTIFLYLIAKQDNKIIDLTSFPILWYIDGEFYNGGVGKVENSFLVKKVGGNFYNVGVEIKTPTKTLQKTVSIPIVKPKVVLKTPLINLESKKIQIAAFPYFFNIKSINDLSFSWVVNSSGQSYNTKGESQLLLNLSGPLKEGIKVTAVAQNKNLPLEIGRGEKDIYVE